MKHITKFDNFINEDVVNANSQVSTRLVKVKYNGEELYAVAIGYASGPYFKEVYYLLDNVPYENIDFEEVKVIDAKELINSK